MKKIEFSILVALILSVTLSCFSAFASTCDDLSKDVLRLHIVADDDSESEQALKLKVRDAVVALGGELFSSADDKQSAKEIAKENLDTIRSAAENVLRENGSEHSVTVEIKEMFFETKYYEDFTMPAGVYDAVRITIGDGEGKNWWCVMFPPLCLGASVDRKELTAALGEDGTQLLEQSPRYEVRFKLVEWLQKLFNSRVEEYEK